MSSIALVTFSRNNVEEVSALLDRFRPLADEAVVIDSSDPARRRELRSRLPSPWASLHPAPAVGYIDLLRPYAVSRARSERVIMVDGDEEPSAALRDRLASLEGDAYVVPRFEADLGAFTHHLRLFRRARVRFRGPAYGFPTIEGTLEKLPRSMHLVHHADHRRYFDKAERQAFLIADAYERPFSRADFVRSLHLPYPRVSPDSDRTLSDPGVRCWIGLEAAYESLRSGSLAWGRFVRHYQQRRWATARTTPPEVVQRRLRTTREIRASGGMSAYLGFDDPAYVERLALRLSPSLSGPDLLEALLGYRAVHGTPVPEERAEELVGAPEPTSALEGLPRGVAPRAD